MRYITLFALLGFLSCQGQSRSTTLVTKTEKKAEANKLFDTTVQTLHVFVALCDNQFQGIVPVSKNLGNGQNPNTNLYWGSAYGMKTFFTKSKDWKLLDTRVISDTILERLIYKNKNTETLLIVDAYDGKFIKQTTLDFLNSSCGKLKNTLHLNGKHIGTMGNAKLCAYIGHDGLMDFDLTQTFENIDKKQRDIIILACYSHYYFSPYLQNANINPLVWTTNLMAPEAYTIHDAIDAYLKKENNTTIQTKAATAYAKYQKCGIKAAKQLLKTGW